jgi:mannose/cellobiose epimerase-like protein (N-acyl-D-glucosamine 2-epimerase family)
MTVVQKKHLFTTGPRKNSSEVRQAHRHADGFYRVYSPDGVVGKDGKRRWNIKENMKLLTTLDEVADHVDKGWGVRMTGPLTSTPSLCVKNIEVIR